ncbi:MRPS6 [Auxenochlorella protothecoides x Auxenochlorella symbiontica]|uniref:37S ribosomal protein MRP17, mitochondrial n=1 Tax=Auxenochlorella protothecoides TaxID=3075 RepID=A0A087SGP6_AUXPR|nr:37S ribosomal protein MRP17, mitochondrial [Auxenochlorella protothecoides]KFM24900.1 37S ribosomal protein MRP17, mitochondrial [Auxenochlorella protothecoides]RMZ52608.1 hypothetical protein APUTEX25_000727 [Auxenochlorella protothecoides]|eukprot:RMZ52608.1 hypothetical protein APUTEX25_000727 [Auxenochlorella protothecoides]
MPLYELFCLAKPGLGKPHLASMISSIGKKVLASGGVLTDVKSHGEQALAYDIRRPGERYSQAHIWQVTFASTPEVLKDIDHSLRVDETVLRWIVQKREYLDRLPNTHRVAKMAHLAAVPEQPADAQQT